MTLYFSHSGVYCETWLCYICRSTEGVKCQYQPNVSSEGGGDICIDIKILGLPPTKDSLYVLPAFVLITIPLLH